MFKNIILAIICFTCTSEKLVKKENKGHDYKKFSLINNQMTKLQIIEILGTPLIIEDLEDVFFYLYSINEKKLFGKSKIIEAKILRLEFKNNQLFKKDLVDYKNFNSIIEKSPKPIIKKITLEEALNIKKIGGINI